jgi:twitching motility two-component system response regulator PilG
MDATTTRRLKGKQVEKQKRDEIVILCAEEEVRDVIAYWLSSRQSRPVVVGNGYHAAEALQNGCRWLITDRVLPPWPGLDTFLTLRSQHPDLRIAFVESGNVHDGILAKVTGASVLLPRPLSRQALAQALFSNNV